MSLKLPPFSFLSNTIILCAPSCWQAICVNGMIYGVNRRVDGNRYPWQLNLHIKVDLSFKRQVYFYAALGVPFSFVLCQWMSEKWSYEQTVCQILLGESEGSDHCRHIRLNLRSIKDRQ